MACDPFSFGALSNHLPHIVGKPHAPRSSGTVTMRLSQGFVVWVWFQESNLVIKVLLLTITIFLSQDYMTLISKVMLTFSLWVILFHFEHEMNSWLWSIGSLQLTIGQEPLELLLVCVLNMVLPLATLLENSGGGSRSPLPCVLSITAI